MNVEFTWEFIPEVWYFIAIFAFSMLSIVIAGLRDSARGSMRSFIIND